MENSQEQVGFILTTNYSSKQMYKFACILYSANQTIQNILK
jgi:hypothetical protein